MAEIVTNVTAAQIRHATMGFRSQGAAKAVPQAATQTVFTVSGGRIQIALLYSLVSVVLAGGATNAKYVATPTVGTANDMCTVGLVTSAEVGSQFVLPLAKGSALIIATAASGSQSGPGYGGQIVAPGTIGFNTDQAAATGSVIHTLYYIPIDDAARVVAN